MLLKQTVPAHEILVVDQSIRHEPETENALEAWAKQGAIRWLDQKEPNASLARNAGALAATGDVLLFLDDDILVEEGFLAAHAKNYVSASTVAVSGQVLEGNRETISELPRRTLDAETEWLNFPRNYIHRCCTSWMMAGNFSIRKQVFLEVGGMDARYKRGAFREESDFAMRFEKAGHRFQFDPEASLYHLATKGAPTGGTREVHYHMGLAGWNFLLGDWYFTIGNANFRTWLRFAWAGCRGLVLTKYNLLHPWQIPIVGIMWLAALPVAGILRLLGPQLISPRQQASDRIMAIGTV
jgi:glycosyltransferase involved in cell wall biosynthesis